MHIFPSFGSFIPCLVLIIQVVTPCDSFQCIHDSLNINGSSVTMYKHFKHKFYKEKRESDSSSFEPLKIHSYIDYIDPGVTEHAMYNIRASLAQISQLLSLLFRVGKVAKPFLLDRTCIKVWRYGPNRERCSKINTGPEECTIDEIPFVIPTMFLKGVEIYDFSEKNPRFLVEPGTGIPNANFILFVVSRSTKLCQADVQAYASHCKITSKSNKPTAGLLNICPEYFSQRIYKASHYFNVLLHEIFHVLGFSSKLFDKFKTCGPGEFCNLPKSIVQRDENGINRLLFPLVVEAVQKHFDCRNEYFGAPLDSEEDISANTTYFTHSHWHPLLMHGSIMTPSFTEEDPLFIDNVTLALFASTGWYIVNFSLAENFNFGKDGGCDFGVTNSSCMENKQLCILNSDSEEEEHCDTSLTSVTTCTEVRPTLICGVYGFNVLGECRTDHQGIFGMDDFYGEHDQRCFMLQEGNKLPKPACLIVKCRTKFAYEVYLNYRWISCQFKDKVQAGNWTLYCPKDKFCEFKIDDKPLHCTADNKFVLSIRMFILEPSLDDLISDNNVKNLKVTTIRSIANDLEIPVSAIVNASLSTFKNIFLDFSICPLEIAKGEDLNALIKRIQNFLDQSSFTKILKGPKDLVIASTDIKINPEDITAFSDYEGFKVLGSVPVVVGIFLVATCLASLIRLYRIHRHRPRRALETEEAVQNSAPETQVPHTVSTRV